MSRRMNDECGGVMVQAKCDAGIREVSGESATGDESARKFMITVSRQGKASPSTRA